MIETEQIFGQEIGTRTAKRCAHCGAIAWYLCDAEWRNARGTVRCNRAICAGCREIDTAGRDLCGLHRPRAPEPAPIPELQPTG